MKKLTNIIIVCVVVGAVVLLNDYQWIVHDSKDYNKQHTPILTDSNNSFESNRGNSGHSNNTNNSIKKPTVKMCYLVMGAERPPEQLWNAVFANSNNKDNSNTSDSVPHQLARHSICLSYKHSVPECTYYPNSTWTEGRNKLLQIAREQEKAEAFQCFYYIFMGMSHDVSVDSAN